jgi:erythromycin esterase-like protein
MWRGAEIETGVPGLNYAGLRTMGDEVLSRLGDEAYSITFTAYQGKSGVAHRPEADAGEIPVAGDDSLEAAFHATGRKLMFLDFRGLRNDPGHWLRKGIVARPLGYAPMRTDWTRHFDAVVFTDTMEPSTRAANGAAVPK